MSEYTWVELLEWYNEALAEYESAVEGKMLDDEEIDSIAELRHEVEELTNEIFRRKMESRGSLPNP